MRKDYYITPEDFERAEENGISNDTLRQRVYTYGWPKEKAITKLTSKGTGWKEYRDIAEEHRICYRTFANRRKRGWDPHEAATKSVMDNSESIKLARESKTDTEFTVEQVQRAPVDYLQYVDEAVLPVMFDGMIQFDQEHKKVTNNIEATKEKMTNKKHKLLKA